MPQNNSNKPTIPTFGEFIYKQWSDAEKAANYDKLAEENKILTARIEQLEGALKIVAEWDLPKTGKTWESGGEMSYEAAFGTNGSRDYMKQIASSALLTSPPTKTE